MIGQEFQSYGTIEARVESLVNHAHSASAKLFGDAKVRDGLVNHYWALLLEPLLRNGTFADRTVNVKDHRTVVTPTTGRR